MARDVFISYSSHDSDVAKQVCARLEAQHIPCWIAPRDITPGMDWSEAIVRGIAECRVFLVVFSPSANESLQVRREIQRAFEKQRVVLPFRIADVLPNPALEYYLSAIHWLDALAPPLESHLEALTQAVQKLLSPEAQNAAVGPPQNENVSPTINLPAPFVGNLPAASAPFIGRAAELRAWSELLLQSATRILTLVGFGGMGKTRSALELATSCASHFPHGAWWVELEEAHEGEAMQQRIALGLHLALAPQVSVREQLIQHLRDRHLLIVLDNTEQIPDAGKTLHALAQAAPHVKWLVTSRRALEIASEQVIEVAPLAPNEAQTLFVDRARARNAGFASGPDNEADIAELCRRLEGMPLAIELAASRVVGMTPRDILNRLGEWFRLLQTRAPHLPPRQRALTGAIEWSHELLGEEDQKLFAQLAVFANGFTLDAAEAVCDVDDVFEGVQELRRHSFLRTEVHAATQQTRFLMLDLVRHYAEQKLQEAQTRRRHAEYFLGYVQQRTSRLRTREEASALEELSLEADNLRTALFWAQQAGDHALCAHLALAFAPILHSLGLWPDAQRCLEAGYEAAAQAGSEAVSLQAALGVQIASLALDRGDAPAARSRAEASLTLYQGLNNTTGIADAINLLGLLARSAGDAEGAQAMFEETLRLRGENEHQGRARSLHNLARLAAQRGDADTAQELYQQSLKHAHVAGDMRSEALTLGNLGVLAFRAGNYLHAQHCYEESLRLRRVLRDQLGIATMLYNLAEIAQITSDLPRAVAFFVHAERTFQELQSAHVKEAADALTALNAQMGSEALEAARQSALQTSWESLV